MQFQLIRTSTHHIFRKICRSIWTDLNHSCIMAVDMVARTSSKCGKTEQFRKDIDTDMNAWTIHHFCGMSSVVKLGDWVNLPSPNQLDNSPTWCHICMTLFIQYRPRATKSYLTQTLYCAVSTAHFTSVNSVKPREYLIHMLKPHPCIGGGHSSSPFQLSPSFYILIKSQIYLDNWIAWNVRWSGTGCLAM